MKTSDLVCSLKGLIKNKIPIKNKLMLIKLKLMILNYFYVFANKTYFYFNKIN